MNQSMLTPTSQCRIATYQMEPTLRSTQPKIGPATSAEAVSLMARPKWAVTESTVCSTLAVLLRRPSRAPYAQRLDHDHAMARRHEQRHDLAVGVTGAEQAGNQDDGITLTCFRHPQGFGRRHGYHDRPTQGVGQEKREQREHGGLPGRVRRRRAAPG